LVIAIPLMITFALFVKMSNGATYAVVPFINRRALGSVSGIVGAGGNAAAVAAGFLFKIQGLDWHTALFVLGSSVTVVSFLALAITIRPEAEREPQRRPMDAFDRQHEVVELAGAPS